MLVKHVLAGHTAGEIINRDWPRIPPDLPLERWSTITSWAGRALPAGRRGRPPGGLVTSHKRQVRAAGTVGPDARRDAMIPIERAKTVRPDCDLWNALEANERGRHDQLAVAQDGQLVGLLARDAIMGFLQLHAEPRG